MQVSLYGYKLDFDEAYLQGTQMIHYINEEAAFCTEKLLKIYSNITTLNELIDFGQVMKEKIYFDTVESMLNRLNVNFKINNINKVSFAIECPKYWGKFETVFSDILDKYVGDKNENSISKKISSLDTSALASILSNLHNSMPSEGQKQASANTYMNLKSIWEGTNTIHNNKVINENMKIVLQQPSSIKALSNAINADIINLVHLLSKHITLVNDGHVEGEEAKMLPLEIYSENYKKSLLISDDIQNNNIPKEKLKPFLAQLIYLSPLEPKNYAIAYYIFGDDNGELENLANLLHVEINFTDYRKAEENAKNYFGYDYSDIDTILSNNMFYKQTKDLLGEDLLKLVNECKYLFNAKLQQLFLSPLDMDNNTQFEEAVSLYGCFDKNEETPLIIFDNNKSIFGRDGFILTDKNIYFYIGPIFRISEIVSFSFSSLSFTINKHKISMLWENLNDEDLTEMYDFLFFFLKVKAYMKKFELPKNLYSGPTLSQKARKDVLQYASCILGIFNDDELRVTVTSLSSNPYIRKKFHNAISNYANLTSEEVPIICYDNTAFGSAREGCLVTTKGIYVHNTFLKPKRFLYSDITTIEINRSVPYKIFINDYELQATLLSTNESKVRFCSILNRLMLDFNKRRDIKDTTKHSEKKLQMSNNLMDTIISIVTNEGIGSEIQKFVHAYSTNPKILKKFSNAINSYAVLDEGEIPVICFDNTLFGSAKEGCLITTTSIHIHNILSKPETFYYQDIKSITLKDPLNNNIYINDTELQTTNLSSHESKAIFFKLLKYIIDNIKQQ